jgi:type I restriction enzyme, S subunit
VIQQLQNIIEAPPNLEMVPEEEHPYDIPGHWKWVRLRSCVSRLQYGYTQSSSFEPIGPHFLRITDIQDNNVDWEHVPYCVISTSDNEKYKLYSNDIVVARTGATTGKSYLISEPPESVFASYLIRLSPATIVDSKFLWYFMNTPCYWRQVTTVSKGIAQPGANATLLGNLAVPLPPLDEQKGIVERIDSLLGKIKEAYEIVEDVPESIEKNFDSLLYNAFVGRFSQSGHGNDQETVQDDGIEASVSEEDVEILPKIPLSWRWCTIEEIAQVKGGKRLPKGESLVNYNTGFPYIKAGDLKKGTVLAEQLQYVTEGVQRTIRNYTVDSGDVYITIVGAKIGDAGIIPEQLAGANLTENAAKICNISGCNNEFLAYWLRSPVSQMLIRGKTLSATLGKLALNRIKTLPVPIPPYEEQIEIVRKLKEVEITIENATDMVKDIVTKTDNLISFVLGRAFRGK